MSRLKSMLIAAAFGLSAMGFSASAAQAADTATLTASLVAALQNCGTLSADIATIQSIIESSGANPDEATAAIAAAQGHPGLCDVAINALSAVAITIGQGNYVANTGGPGGGAPIGSPPFYVSGGGSDYIFRR